MNKLLLFILLLLCSCTAHRKSESDKAFTDTTAINTERRVVTAKEAEYKRAESAELDECAIILSDGSLRISPDGSLTLRGIKSITSSRASSQGETEAKAKEEARGEESRQERRGVSESERKRTEAKADAVSARRLIAILILFFVGGAEAWRFLRGNDK